MKPSGFVVEFLCSVFCCFVCFLSWAALDSLDKILEDEIDSQPPHPVKVFLINICIKIDARLLNINWEMIMHKIKSDLHRYKANSRPGIY